MKQTTKRFASLIVSLLLILGAFIVIVDLVVPAYGEAQRAKADLLSRQAFIEEQRSTIGEVKKLIASYEGQIEVQEQVSLALPSHQDVAGALAQLSGIAQTSFLAPQSFSASITEVPNAALRQDRNAKSQTTTLAKPIGTLTLHVRFIGSYGDIKKFFEKLETNIRIFDVRTLSMQPVGRSNQDLYSYDMTVATYYQNP